MSFRLLRLHSPRAADFLTNALLIIEALRGTRLSHAIPNETFTQRAVGQRIIIREPELRNLRDLPTE